MPSGSSWSGLLQCHAPCIWQAELDTLCGRVSVCQIPQVWLMPVSSRPRTEEQLACWLYMNVYETPSSLMLLYGFWGNYNILSGDIGVRMMQLWGPKIWDISIYLPCENSMECTMVLKIHKWYQEEVLFDLLLMSSFTLLFLHPEHQNFHASIMTFIRK